MNWRLVSPSDRSIYRQKPDNKHKYLVEHISLEQNNCSQNCNLECYMHDLTRNYCSDRCHIQHILRSLRNNIRILLTVLENSAKKMNFSPAISFSRFVI